MRLSRPSLLVSGLAVAALLGVSARVAANPVLFVTATPSSADTITGDFTHFVCFVGNHFGKATRAPRGGDLYIRYDDGSLRNLTAECGFGTTPGQEICVREPNVHWNGEKAVFSMAVGGTGANPAPSYFQLYEVTGILQGQTAAMTLVAGQPNNRNNIQPVYASDDSILFGTDMPVTKQDRHYPQLDEYESTPVVSGLWSLNPARTDYQVLDHCPSGDFTAIIDSFGRVVFTRWDHLKRDQQSDLWVDGMVKDGSTSRALPVTYENEDSDAFTAVAFGDEYFPENGRLHPGINTGNNPSETPHPYWDQDFVPGTKAHDFNFFFPWMMNQDGTDAEVLNHLGRHEFFGYVGMSHDDFEDYSANNHEVRSFNQIREHPNVPGRFYGVDAQEFGTHGSGRIIYFDAPLGANADDINDTVVDVTPPSAGDWDGNVATTRFRDPMIKSDGTLWASISGTYAEADNTASDQGAPNPYPLSSNHHFKIRQLVTNSNGYYEPGPAMTPDIIDTVTYTSEAFFPIRQVTYTGPMWELFPVEVKPRTPPAPTEAEIPAIEQAMLESKLGGPSGVADFQEWLRQENLALVVTRDVTMRADKQQEYNLKVSGSSHQTAGPGETPQEIGYMQFLAARYVRGYSNNQVTPSPGPGRRILPRIMEELTGPDAGPTAPEGSMQIADDGSVAALLPADRAMTWQLTKDDGTPVVRERYWLTFQAGEIRTCTNCHGVNNLDVFGNPAPTNQPQALNQMLDWWLGTQGGTSDVTGWELY